MYLHFLDVYLKLNKNEISALDILVTIMSCFIQLVGANQSPCFDSNERNSEMKQSTHILVPDERRVGMKD